jgi:hypothetical protein
VKCTKCEEVIKKMGQVCPEGYCSFGWGNTLEQPQHFYCMVIAENKNIFLGAGQVIVAKICEIENPKRRVI